MNTRSIVLKGARCHNLKSVDITLAPNQLVVFTGVSGSGKSSLAFDTLYAEGQRRYVESLSNFARRHLGDMAKPEVDHISGLTPTISIEQKTAGRNPRSTVGTMTEVYDYLRVLYARVATPYCPVSGEAVSPQSKERIIRSVQALDEGAKIIVLAPYARGRKGEFIDDFKELLRKGFMRVRVDGEIIGLEEDLALDGSVSHDVDVVIDRLVVRPSDAARIAESVTSALELGDGVCRVLVAPGDAQQELLFSMHAYSEASGLSYQALEPHDFSFNSPTGMCPSCEGLGETLAYDLDRVIDPKLSIADDCCSVASSYGTVRYGNIYDNLARLHQFDVTTPWEKLSDAAKEVFLHGTKKKWTRMQFQHPKTGATWHDYVNWRGVLYEAHRRYADAKSDSYRRKAEKLMQQQQCPDCHGLRLKAYPAAAQLAGVTIGTLCQLTVAEALAFFEGLTLEASAATIAEELLKEVTERLRFLLDVGLHYLALDRTAPTLSGGEAQRVRLASQIGCGLVGVTYILDEPSIGLHPRDNKKLIDTLIHLRDMGNTVVVVEHDEETILAADRIVDFGPGPGSRGGEIVVDGSLKKLLSNKQSLTGQYLAGSAEIAIPEKRRKPKRAKLTLTGVSHHNLKDVTAKIPLGLFVAVTGVSGSGKSSLVTDVLYPALANHLHNAEHRIGAHKAVRGIDNVDKVIAIDQSPIGRNPRSNPSTYIKLFDEIRDLFTKLPESRARGYKAGRFSFNVKEGSCTRCSGMGMVKVDMDFMEDAWIDCPVCRTRRFDQETLSVLYKGKSIYDVLEMEVAEALPFFENIPSIRKKLEVLQRVGMEYVKLGQPSTTLSGGEAQRIKLAKELVRPATGRTLYILDEPTTGLHFHDIKHLLEVLHSLVDRGNTVLVIEHNMEVVKTADWIVDLGPEGGAGGGQLVAEGPPEAIAKMDTPTGEAVSEALFTDRASRKANLVTKKRQRQASDAIRLLTVSDACQNNLKHVEVAIPRDKLTVFTGPSGSGKTSLAFDTIYAEGQRRYTESLSPYARQFVKQMPKPKVGQVEGLSPAVAIEQKAHAGNPRSTVGTMTELYDYIRVLFARVGIPHCPETGERIQAVSKDQVVDAILDTPPGTPVHVLAPLTVKKGEPIDDIVSRYRRQGYLRIRLNGTFFHLEDESDAIQWDRRRKNELFLVIDRLKVDPSGRSRIYEAVENADVVGDGHIVVMQEETDILFNLSFSVPSTGRSYPEITPHSFSFNSPEGMCQDCQGLGYQYGADLTGNQALLALSPYALVSHLWGPFFTKESLPYLKAFLTAEKINPKAALEELPTKKVQLFLNGAGEDRWYKLDNGLEVRWLGINHVLAKAGKAAHREIRQSVIPLMEEHACLSCQGARVNPLSRHVTIEDRNIGQVCQLPIQELIPWIDTISLTQQQGHLLEEVMDQLRSRLQFLDEVGLGYIALDRRAPTLSGGEAQRIRLAKQLGTSLRGVLYVLDEPTIGLHPHDNDRLNAALTKLKDLGNTLLLVEHDPLTVAMADHLVDFGPQSGEHGGQVTAKGSIKQVMKAGKSLTGRYLSGKEAIAVPSSRRTDSEAYLSVRGATANNLKGVDADIPVGALTCVTGVSGSGKSTLINGIVKPAVERTLGFGDVAECGGATVSGIDHFERLIAIDQNPIGRTVRSDVGTYCEVLPPMRDFFASLPSARTKGLAPGNFSFNHRKGMCTHCWGMGYKKVELHFLPPVRVRCEECHGLRLNPVSLEVEYSGKNFGQHLNTTVDQARVTFENHKRITRVLDTLIDVGLGYLKLGQKMQTLSGGEAQRIKLSRELSKRSSGTTLYLLDEPTTGLHPDDIKKLLHVLHRLVDKGNTMVIIEHNLDMIKNADHIIDIGPGPGAAGGRVLCTGTPEKVAKHKKSLTGKYLKPCLV